VNNVLVSKFGEDEFYHYYNPGRHLPEKQLRAMHASILGINKDARHPIEHKLLEELPTLEALQERYASMIVCIIRVAGRDSGFLLSPILKAGRKTFIHAGLVIINHNKGSNLLALAGSRTVMLAYEKLGRCYSTNISSTPAIIEAFTMLSNQCWPTPKSDLIRPPREYKEVAEALVNNYVQHFFPDPESVIFDERRFVLHSESKKMGFNTEFRQISRSSSFEYLNFCFTWLDYNKEEDLIQVGVIDQALINKIRLWRLSYAARFFKKDLGRRVEALVPRAVKFLGWGVK
jgi:hypothetical protein